MFVIAHHLLREDLKPYQYKHPENGCSYLDWVDVSFGRLPVFLSLSTCLRIKKDLKD